MEKTAQEIVEMYSYEGPENSVEDQILAIEESVKKRASIRALTIGVLGCLLLGIGMSLTMVTSDFFVLGIVVGIVGLAVVCVNYLLYKRHLASLREAAKPQIMSLASQL